MESLNAYLMSFFLTFTEYSIVFVQCGCFVPSLPFPPSLRFFACLCMSLRVFVCLCVSLRVFVRLYASLRSLGVFVVFR